MVPTDSSATTHPDSLRIWSVLATVSDRLDEAKRLEKLQVRPGSYLQGYGGLFARVNRWDPAALKTDVIWHSATSAEVAPIVAAYAEIRLTGLAGRSDANPGRLLTTPPGSGSLI